jgi:protein-S-isoprenylcysteine O-methyltransferase Ste14
MLTSMDGNGYGLWFLVAVNTAVVLLFALSFFHPSTRRDWKAMGAFSAFVVALFTEMYGFPLTVYLLSGWLGSRAPWLDLTHDGGHLWSQLLGWQGDPHLSPFHLVSYALIIGGFWLIAAGWRRLHTAAQHGALAATGPYARVRHPQYAGFLLIVIGFLVQWPTVPTLLMFPVLVLVYRRLAIAEEREVRERFGGTWDAYAAATPRFVPGRRGRLTPGCHAKGARG